MKRNPIRLSQGQFSDTFAMGLMSLRLFEQTKRSDIQPCEGDFQILDGKMQMMVLRSMPEVNFQGLFNKMISLLSICP